MPPVLNEQIWSERMFRRSGWERMFRRSGCERMLGHSGCERLQPCTRPSFCRDRVFFHSKNPMQNSISQQHRHSGHTHQTRLIQWAAQQPTTQTRHDPLQSFHKRPLPRVSPTLLSPESQSPANVPFLTSQGWSEPLRAAVRLYVTATRLKSNPYLTRLNWAWRSNSWTTQDLYMNRDV